MRGSTWIVLTIVILLLGGGGLYLAFSLDQPGHSQPVKKKVAKSSTPVSVKPKQPEKKKVKKLPNMGIQAKSVILMNAKDGSVLYEKNVNESLPTASMSKMMTELLVLEAIHNHKISWNQTVKISDYVNFISNHPGYASVHLQKGQPYTVRKLLDAMAIHSANGAAIALAETVAGSEKSFVTEMNAKAQQLGLTHSHFVNSSGLDNSDLGQYYSVGVPSDTNIMSANDLALLARQLIRTFPEILKVTVHSNVTINGQTYPNSNWMLPTLNRNNMGFAGVDGLKTGYTDVAGHCFVGTVQKNNKRFISVVMGASSSSEAFSETTRLYKAAYQLGG